MEARSVVTPEHILPHMTTPSTPPVFATHREIAASAEEIFAAFQDPERFARWWGPAGFTNTFHSCDFRTGGTWSYTMFGPDGAKFPNQSEFVEVDAARRVVIQHVSGPQYRLTITFEPTASGTRVDWVQIFEHPEVAKRIAHIVTPANEQNLDRLTAEVLARKSA